MNRDTVIWLALLFLAPLIIAVAVLGGVEGITGLLSLGPGAEEGPPTLDVVLLDYGSSSQEARYTSLAPLLETEFGEAVHGRLRMNVSTARHHEIPFHSFYEVSRWYPHLRDVGPRRSYDEPRLWYYNHTGLLLQEAASVARNDSSPETDLAVVLTDLQLPGDGAVTAVDRGDGGRMGVIVVESLALDGWQETANYSRELVATPRLAGAALHQIGHYYGANHTDAEQACVMNHATEPAPGDDPRIFCPAALEQVTAAAAGR